MLPDDITSLPLVRQVAAWDPGCLVDGHREKGELTLIAATSHWQALGEFLKAEAGFSLMCDLTCVDWYPANPRFELVCTLYALERHEFLRVKTKVEAEAGAPSLCPVWPAANWYEREVFDLFGVHFHGHPNMTRILMPEDWTAFPMRKDYPVEGYR